ncbi:uncharacterized protein JCM15063_003780 [Sporobolomyces koalae]|uniref:uncharacterized protein n=1 Tax=Sporobolomyces koalae TaxID=500713 RepID=UPI003174E52C
MERTQSIPSKQSQGDNWVHAIEDTAMNAQVEAPETHTIAPARPTAPVPTAAANTSLAAPLPSPYDRKREGRCASQPNSSKFATVPLELFQQYKFDPVNNEPTTMPRKTQYDINEVARPKNGLKEFHDGSLAPMMFDNVNGRIEGICLSGLTARTGQLAKKIFPHKDLEANLITIFIELFGHIGTRFKVHGTAEGSYQVLVALPNGATFSGASVRKINEVLLNPLIFEPAHHFVNKSSVAKTAAKALWATTTNSKKNSALVISVLRGQHDPTPSRLRLCAPSIPKIPQHYHIEIMTSEAGRVPYAPKEIIDQIMVDKEEPYFFKLGPKSDQLWRMGFTETINLWTTAKILGTRSSEKLELAAKPDDEDNEPWMVRIVPHWSHCAVPGCGFPGATHNTIVHQWWHQELMVSLNPIFHIWSLFGSSRKYYGLVLSIMVRSTISIGVFGILPASLVMTSIW